jgi:hypothetical protein
MSLIDAIQSYLLKNIQEPYESYASAFLAVMESPAIVVGVILGKGLLSGKPPASAEAANESLKQALHDAVLGRGVLLLIGAMIIGALSGPAGMSSVEGLFVTPFQGVLALFLLEMGMVAGRRIGDLRRVGGFLMIFGLLAPLFHGAAGVLLGTWTGLSCGGATLLGVLSASASYIAAPAAVRLALPEANPTYSLTAALAITFPFNITVGVPLNWTTHQAHPIHSNQLSDALPQRACIPQSLQKALRNAFTPQRRTQQ